MTNEQFKAWRKKQGFTQQQAANALGVIRMTVTNYERGSLLGSGKEIKIPLVVDLACAAIASGLKPFSEQK